MALFSRTLAPKDITAAVIGKRRRYKLPRGEHVISFTGTLLAFYREALTEQDHHCLVSNYLDVLALFKTEKGQYFIYYEVLFHDPAFDEERRCFVKVLKELEELSGFLDRMNYANLPSFRGIVLSDAWTHDAGTR